MLIDELVGDVLRVRALERMSVSAVRVETCGGRHGTARRAHDTPRPRCLCGVSSLALRDVTRLH